MTFCVEINGLQKQELLSNTFMWVQRFPEAVDLRTNSLQCNRVTQRYTGLKRVVMVIDLSIRFHHIEVSLLLP